MKSPTPKSNFARTNPELDFFFNKEKKWHAEFAQLRTIILSCGLSEELKWGQACYTLPAGSSPKGTSRNIVLIHGFKEYCALLFFKGALLSDPKRILVQQTENVQAARQVRFTDVSQIKKLKTTIASYVKEAVEVEKKGLKVDFKKTTDFKVPDEFQQLLDEDASLRKAFFSLTPGRQRGYLFYFSAAKQSKTRASRIGKYIPKILDGKGLDD